MGRRGEWLLVDHSGSTGLGDLRALEILRGHVGHTTYRWHIHYLTCMHGVPVIASSASTTHEPVRAIGTVTWVQGDGFNRYTEVGEKIVGANG